MPDVEAGSLGSIAHHELSLLQRHRVGDHVEELLAAPSCIYNMYSTPYRFMRKWFTPVIN